MIPALSEDLRCVVLTHHEEVKPILVPRTDHGVAPTGEAEAEVLCDDFCWPHRGQRLAQRSPHKDVLRSS